MSAVKGELAPIANVLTITRPEASRQTSSQSIEVLSTIEDVDSTHSLSPNYSGSHLEKSLDRETSPFSPFYNPAPTRYSLDRNKSESKQDINVIHSTSYDTDVEACLTPQKTEISSGGKASLLMNSRGGPDCTVWPGQRALKMKKKAMRRERGKHMMCCGCMARMNKKMKIWVKVLIALVVIGIAVAVGLGVSRAVGGGVWKNTQNVNAPIANS